MLLKNFPLSKAHPHGRAQTQNYVQALDIKQEADQVVAAMAKQDGDRFDLDPASNGVAMSNGEIWLGDNLRRGKVTGVASFEGTKESPEKSYLQADIVPEGIADRTLTCNQEGDIVHYTRQYKNKEAVEHMVLDTATNTFNYFLRNDKGQFIKNP